MSILYTRLGGANSIAEIARRIRDRSSGKLEVREVGDGDEPGIVFTILEDLVNSVEQYEGFPVWTVWEGSVLKPEHVKALRRYGPVAVPSTYNREVFAEAGFPARLIPYGVDSEVWSPGRAPACSGMGFATAYYVTARKNVRAIDEAFRSAFPAGGASMCYKMFHQAGDHAGMRSLTNTLRAKEVVWDHYGEDYLARFVVGHHVFVSASLCEGFNLPVLEAMACGLPVIVPRFSGHLDFVDEDVGWLVGTYEVPGWIGWRSPTHEGLVRAMRAAASDPALVDMGLAARRKALEYPWSRTIDGLVAMSEECARR